jgi:Sulfotransferase family
VSGVRLSCRADRVTRAFNISQVVFIVGFPRSGTTWFSNLINSHPMTVYRHEPFGRDYRSFGEPLFSKLRFGNGLSDEEYFSVIKNLMRAKVNTDRPPFFNKQFQRINHTTFQKLIWLGARATSLLSPTYALLFTPREGPSLVLVIKETRSSVNLDSIVKGARANKLIVLVRHPYGVIASHLSGIKAGLMTTWHSDLRREWLEAHRDYEYVKDRRFTEENILRMRDVEFGAIQWRAQNDEYLRMHGSRPDSRLIIYERFLSNVMRSIRELFEFIGLESDDQVFQFVEDSSNSEPKANLLLRDAGSTYYSVFRGKGFDPNSWKRTLSSRDVDLIDKHTYPLVQRLGLDKSIDHLDVPARGIAM